MSKPAPKQSAEAIKAKVEHAQQQLEAQLQALQTSEDWKRTLERMAVLGRTSINRFSFNNILLLLSQRPETRHAATFNAWLKRGRYVRKGEKGLHVLKPRINLVRDTDAAGATTESRRLLGFSYLTVFALEQTEGEELPLAIEPCDFSAPEGFEWTVEQLREVVKTLPHVSSIELRPRQKGDYAGAAGWFHKVTHQIVVITGESSPAQTLSVLLHEVAHSILHGDGEHHATPTAEVEAESTAFVVAHALGLDTSSFSLPYVATWVGRSNEKNPTKAVSEVGERIRKAAALILSTLFPQDEESAEQPGLAEAA